MTDVPELVQELRRALRSSKHTVVFTGAGVSADSGVPTFRNPLNGYWEQIDPAEFASAQAFRDDPELVWGWYEWRRSQILRAEPNAAHRAIAELEHRIPAFTLVTQNVDDLHERAGSTDPVHVHGSLMQPRCNACARPVQLPGPMTDQPHPGGRLRPPRCKHCGGWGRPGVVWFGERLPKDAWRRAQEGAERCDLLLCIGTSAIVTPVSELPLIAKRRGARIAQVNPTPTQLDEISDWNVRDRAAAVLPLLLF